MRLTLDEIRTVAAGVEKYSSVINRPTPESNIHIKNNRVELIVDGTPKARKAISTAEIDVEAIEYNKNVFNSIDVRYSPMEADREKNWPLWKDPYRNIDFPKLIPLPLMCWMILGKWPDVMDLCKLYALSYTEPVPEGENIDNRGALFTDSKNAKFTNIGTILTYTDGTFARNKVIRFKKEYEQYLKSFPCNEFTTEQLFSRIYKAYGSCVRDPYTIVRAVELGASAEYDTYLDIVGGMDGIIEGIPYYGYVETDVSKAFRKIKQDTRHTNLPQDKGIALEKCDEKRNGVYIIKDVDLMNVIKDARIGDLKGIKVYRY